MSDPRPDRPATGDPTAMSTREFELIGDPAAVLGTAADLASPHVPTAAAQERAGDVRDGLAGNEFTTANAVAVLDGAQLVGVLPLPRLLAAGEEALISELMDRDPPRVAPDADQKQAAHAMIERGVSVLVVTDKAGRFVGLIPPHRLLRVLYSEHADDLARIGGFLKGSRRARHAAEEAVTRRIWHRLPWLLVGVVGAMGSVALIAGFERQLDDKVLIAFFLPAVVYLADAVGTQTETLMIRALSVGVHWRQAIRRELLSGVVIGMLIGTALGLFALAGWGDEEVSLAVGISLLAAASAATSIAMVLAFTLQRLGVDPAFAAGPIATVIQDLFSIAVYLVVATALVG